MIIVAAGTPGTGKTTLLTVLSRLLLSKGVNVTYTSLTELVIENGLWISYDWLHRSFIIDVEKLVKVLSAFARDNTPLLLEVHDLEIVWEAGLEPTLVLLLRCNPKSLYERLKPRQWPRVKLVENVEAELIGYVATQAYTYWGRRVCEIDTTGINAKALARHVLRLIEKPEGIRDSGLCKPIDWLQYIDVVDFVSRLHLNINI